MEEVSETFLNLNFLKVPALVFLCSLNCLGQEFSFKNYNEQNGLPSSEVYFVFQDHDGFMWFATDNGVVRFDGGEFKLFNKSNGLADAVVFSITEDPKNNLWFRTFTGLTSTYTDGKMIPYKYNDRLKSVRGTIVFPSMAADSLGQVYVSTGSKFFMIKDNGEVRRIPAPDSAIYVYQVTKKDFLVTATGTRKYVVAGEKKYALNPGHEEPGFTLFKIWNNKMYLSIGNYIVRMEGAEAKVVYKSKVPIISFAVDNENNFWVGFLAGGARRFSNDSFLQSREIPLLKELSVTSVFQDKDGRYWFSTLEKGVYNIHNPKIADYDLHSTSKTNFVLSNNTSVLIGFYNGQLISCDKKTKHIKWSINLKKPIVAGTYLQDDKLFWIVTPTTAALINEQGQIVKMYPYMKGQISIFVVKNFFKNVDRIWSVSGARALEFDMRGHLVSVHQLPGWCRNIFVLKDQIYLASVTGLLRTDSSFSKFTEISEFINDKISDLTLLPGNRVLVCTVGNGFKIIDGDKITSFSKDDGLIFENIYSTAVDSSLWLGTEKGFFKVNLKLLLDKGTFAFELLNKEAGLTSNKVNFIIRDGKETWCIYNDGFSVFNDHEVRFASQQLIPRLSGVMVNSSEVDASQLLDLSYLDNSITFSFGFQSFDNRNIYLRHRSSSSSQWSYTEALNINYHALSPGKYEFDVEYSTDRFQWKKISFPNVVYIRPPWWETIYFRLIILLITALVFFIYFRSKYKSKLLKLEMAEKLKEEKERIAQDLHDNIGSKLVSLSLGLNHVVKEYDIANETAEMIYSNVNTTVAELRDTIWAIQKEGVTIAEFCDKIKNLVWRLRQNNESAQYDLHIHTEYEDQVLKPSQAINLYRIVQESIANSQKHSGANLVSISIFYDESIARLYIKVEDNGKGFDINNSSTKESYGLKNMRSRAEEVNAAFEIVSGLNKGTEIMVSLQL